MRENRSDPVPLQHRTFQSTVLTFADIYVLRHQNCKHVVIGKKNKIKFEHRIFFSPADLLCPHVEQDVGGREANCDTVNQQGAGVRDQGDALQGCREKNKHLLRLADFCCLEVLTPNTTLICT